MKAYPKLVVSHPHCVCGCGGSRDKSVNDEEVNPEAPYEKVAIGKVTPGFLRGWRAGTKIQAYGGHKKEELGYMGK